MNDAQFAELAAWIAAAGLAGEAEPDMVGGFAERLVAMGSPLARATVIVDTLHPVYEGRAFGWRAAGGETTLQEYDPTNEGEAAERWRNSPLYRLVQTGAPLMRRRID